MKKAQVFSQSGSLIGPVEFVSSGLVIGEKVRKSMSKAIQYSEEPLGELKLVTDFLPSPEELTLKKENTKVTISLSSESVAYFKDVAKRHHLQYQKIIRELLDEYVAQQKRR